MISFVITHSHCCSSKVKEENIMMRIQIVIDIRIVTQYNIICDRICKNPTHTVVWKTFGVKKISYGSLVTKFKHTNIISLNFNI